MGEPQIPIGEIPSPNFSGLIGVHPYPGKAQSLVGDLTRLKNWGANFLITFVEQSELRELNITDISSAAQKLGITWYHLPIGDMGCPDDSFDPKWLKIRNDLHACLKIGGRVALHCKGGWGRSGTIAARLLIEFGHPADEAIAMVRTGRGPEAIETKIQEDYLHQLAAN